MVKITLELSQEENLFLYSLKQTHKVKSKAEVIKSILEAAMREGVK